MAVGRSITAEQTVAALQALVAERGCPENIRCDNGPELTAHALRDWCRLASVTTSYIEPGAPWQNPFAESFNARVRDELVRTRLRRALVALERGRSDAPEGLMDGVPPDIQALVTHLSARVAVMCQPSEALDVGWKRDWDDLLDDVARLRQWVAA